MGNPEKAADDSVNYLSNLGRNQLSRIAESYKNKDDEAIKEEVASDLDKALKPRS